MFEWIGAGNTYPVFGAMTLYVKFRERKGDYYEIEHPMGFIFGLKDREVFAVRRGAPFYNHPHYFTGYDFCVNTDMLGINSACISTGVMVIYESKESQKRHAYDRTKFNKGKLFCDSGGFKLAVGTEEFIDPLDLAKYYNKYANYGMGLDIPPSKITKFDELMVRAEIQKKNNDIILQHLDKDVTLYNISHGFSASDRKAYIEKVYDDRLHHWAIGSTYYGNTFDFLTRVLTSIDLVKDTAKDFHVFGVAAAKVIPILSWLGRYFNITSDSSTHVQCGKNNINVEIHGFQLKKIRVGSTNPGKINLASTPSRLPCSCNICKAFESNEVYHKSTSGSGIHFNLLGLHNLTVMAQYSSLWANLAMESTPKEYKEVYKKILSNGEAKTWLSTIDFIEDYMERGLSAANKRFSSFKTSAFGFDLNKGCPTNYSLLDIEEADMSGTQEAVIMDASYGQVGEEVINAYLDYHKNNSVKKAKKKKTKEELRAKKDAMGMGVKSGKSKFKVKTKTKKKDLKPKTK